MILGIKVTCSGKTGQLRLEVAPGEHWGLLFQKVSWSGSNAWVTVVKLRQYRLVTFMLNASADLHLFGDAWRNSFDSNALGNPIHRKPFPANQRIPAVTSIGIALATQLIAWGVVADEVN